MSATDSTFDGFDNLDDSDLSVGIEIEYPENDGEFLKDAAKKSGNFRDDVRHNGGWPGSWGSMHHDGTVGAEIVNDNPFSLGDAPKFYEETIEIAEDEYGVLHEPTGILKGGSTAGLHIHLSPLTDEQAADLAEMSMEPWMQVFVCSSVVNMGGPNMPVFRGESYCNLRSDLNGSRYNVVNSRRGGHYEWRLPEPMTPTHFRYVAKFLRIFDEAGREQAEDYAKSILRRKEDDITSIIRAKEIGVPSDFDSLPIVSRNAATDSELFYRQVNRASGMPYIYRVTFDGTDYYAFETNNEDYEGREWQMGGFDYRPTEFTVDTVLYADTLEEQDDPDITSPINDAVENRSEMRGSNERRETEATGALKQVLDKSF